jgi:hypothetical protein
MERKILIEHGQRILELAGKWCMENLSQQEYRELNTWYFALEERDLGPPLEITVDLVEKRLHEQLFKDKKNDDEEQGPAHPWH